MICTRGAVRMTGTACAVSSFREAAVSIGTRADDAGWAARSKNIDASHTGNGADHGAVIRATSHAAQMRAITDMPRS